MYIYSLFINVNTVTMNKAALFIKKLLRLPELLLLLSMLMGPLFIVKSVFHSHDTGGDTWVDNLVCQPLNLIQFTSWLLHVLLRRYGLLAETWRWIQVGGSFISMTSIVAIKRFPEFMGSMPPRRFLDSEPCCTFPYFHSFELPLVVSIAILFICQFLFWMAAAILFL